MVRALAFPVFITGCLVFQAITVEAQTKPKKKLIEFGWDEPDTAFLREHIGEMEQTPFDGCVFHVLYTKPDGSKGNFTWECWGKRAFTNAELASARDDLKQTQIRRFTENFLRFNTTPADVDWFDDFSAIASNARLAASIARESRCRGILFDIEQYGAPLFNYRRQRDARTKSWDLYAKQVRLRGREVTEAFQEGFPGVTLFLTFGYSLPAVQSRNGAKPLADCSYGLLAPFIDGMVDAVKGKTRIVDGHELSYGYRDLPLFAEAYKTMQADLLPIVGDPKKYGKVTSLAFGIWLDHDWRKRGWDPENPSKNYFTPEALEASVRKALEISDEYVWLYSETPRWWSKDGKRLKLPDAYDAALRKAREPASPAFCLGVADTMEKVFRDEPWNKPPVPRITIEAARNEVEGIQLVIVPAEKRELQSVTVDVTDLVSSDSSRIDKSHITWRIVGYVETEKPAYPTRKVGWWPDPLLPARPFDIKSGHVQPIWIGVRTPPEARAGLYRGQIRVHSSDGQEVSLQLELSLWDFAIPGQQHLETCLPLRPNQLQQFYRLPKVPVELYEKWIDFCLDHRISVNLCDWTDFSRDMERLVERQLGRGGSAFSLAYAWFNQGEADARRQHNANQVARIKKLYDRARARGWIDRAYIYCHDEISKNQYPFAHELYSELKKAMPDLRLMQTFYRDEPVGPLDDVLDIWAPNTARYRPAEFQAQQAKGDGVWWYVCCGPGKPYANLMIEWPAMDHRILLWQNWKYHVTGFLYWGLCVWRDNLKGETRWPGAKWNPATWRNSKGQAHNGDGQLIYPGPDRSPISSIRLENLRDGIEDYETLWLLREGVKKLAAKDSEKHKLLIARARKALAVDDSIVKDLTHFTNDPRRLRRERSSIAELVTRVQKALSTP